MGFVNRERELRFLDEINERPGAQFVVLYGRRRIGKTTLVTHWRDKHFDANSIYWVAHKSSPSLLLEKFSHAVCGSLPEVKSPIVFSDWAGALRQVFELARDRRIILILDEFPYLVQSYPEITSILQTLWDQSAGSTGLRLIVSGSHYHMMKKEFVSGRGPLYGRSTADILLREIPPSDLHLFLPRYSPEQIVETYSVVGGVPKYLEMWDDRKPVMRNVLDLILSPITIFRQEAVFLIQDEISEPRTYMAILEAIGGGVRRPSAIAERTGIAINHVGKYLHSLCELGFLRRLVSLDTQDVARARSGIYEITDSYLRFYFRYIYPHLELIEQERTKRLMEIISADLARFVGSTGFEELARRQIVELGDNHQLPFVPERVGRFWTRKTEIDIAAINRPQRCVLLGECKWTNRKMTPAVLDELKAKAEGLAKISSYKKHYALFSKAGFTRRLIEQAGRDGVLLFSGAEFSL